MTEREDERVECVLCGEVFMAGWDYGWRLYDQADTRYNLNPEPGLVFGDSGHLVCICGDCCRSVYLEGRRVHESGAP